MRILQFSSSYPLSEDDATTPVVREMARALVRRGHEVHVVVPSRDGQARLEQREPGLVVHWVRYAPIRALQVIGHGQSLRNDRALRGAVFAALPLYLAATWRATACLTRTWRPDAVHSHWVLPGGFQGGIVARWLRCPHVISLHGSDIFVARSRGPFRAVARWAFRGARHVIACSPYLREQALTLGAPTAGTHFMAFGVDTQRFAPGVPDPGAPPVVLALGRLVEKKGFRQLVAQAGSYLDADARAELWIAGEGDDRPLLEAARDALHPELAARVKLLGSVAWPQVPALLRQARIFVMPSIRDASGNEDGLPNVVLEAMSAGKAIVASDIGALSNVIEDGRTGRIVPAGQPAALAAAIRTLLAAPEEAARLGDAAAAHARAHLTWSAYAAALEGFYAR